MQPPMFSNTVHCSPPRYVKHADKDAPGDGYRPGAVPQDRGKSTHTCSCPERQTLVRHVLTFVSSVRQDIRNNRIDVSNKKNESLSNLHLQLTPDELSYMEEAGVYEFDINSPLIMYRFALASCVIVWRGANSADSRGAFFLLSTEAAGCHKTLWPCNICCQARANIHHHCP